jgi:hypothetical protein
MPPPPREPPRHQGDRPLLRPEEPPRLRVRPPRQPLLPPEGRIARHSPSLMRGNFRERVAVEERQQTSNVDGAQKQARSAA